MKRSTPLARKTPMKRSPFKTADRATALRRSAMRARVKKPTVAEGKRFIDACRGEECYLRVPGVCCSIGWSHASVVDCHSNQERHGKGGALKAKHVFTVPGCGPCHAWIDQGKAAREVKFATWDRAYERWLPVRARKMGLKEEEGAVLDSNSDAHGLAHAARPQREEVCLGTVPTDGGVGNDGVSAGSAEGAEQRSALCLG
ncbi:DUF1364 family protein [Caballeronia novacaledonica]|uniref:DUF1364 family protein n=1 Tax=Caballeronia novacaledonica TaxID=1544861 RepID=A0ACB5QIS1_9BURK|nr:DUF1364 family protein [Caballeronia novacaledonica]